jgi:hypothetical protein
MGRWPTGREAEADREASFLKEVRTVGCGGRSVVATDLGGPAAREVVDVGPAA